MEAKVLELLDRLETVRNWLHETPDLPADAPIQETADAIELVWKIHGEVV